jgi:hypothetical protein
MKRVLPDKLKCPKLLKKFEVAGCNSNKFILFLVNWWMISARRISVG